MLLQSKGSDIEPCETEYQENYRRDYLLVF